MSDSDSDFNDDHLVSLRKKRLEELKLSNEQKTERRLGSGLGSGLGPIYISGPNTMITMNKNAQTIRLFGEWHGYEQNCESVERLRGKRIYSILNYLEEELKKGGIDLYIEAPLIHLQSPETLKSFYEHASLTQKYRPKEKLAYLVQVRDRLKWCLNPSDRHKCVYKNARIHSTDVRPFYIFADMNKEIRFKIDKGAWETFQQKYSKVINRLSEIKNCDQYVEYIFELIDQSNPIIKQIKKSGIPKNELIEAIKKVCEKRDAVKRVQQYSTWLSSPEQGDGWAYNQQLMDVVQEQISVLHDVYTFLRMIKPMDGKVQKNVIFYGGLAHVEALVIMLQQVGFTIISKGDEIAMRCVKI